MHNSVYLLEIFSLPLHKAISLLSIICVCTHQLFQSVFLLPDTTDDNLTLGTHYHKYKKKKKLITHNSFLTFTQCSMSNYSTNIMLLSDGKKERPS